VTRSTLWGLALTFSATACGPNKSNWDQSIPDGVYEAKAPVCKSTGASPAYREPVQRLVLLDFADLVSHEVIVNERFLTRSLRDQDCELRSDEDVFRNTNRLFATRLSRSYQFEPKGCDLAIDLDGELFTVNHASSDFFVAKEDLREDITYDVTPHDDGAGFSLITQDHPDLSRVWETFGCPASDRLVYELKTKKG